MAGRSGAWQRQFRNMVRTGQKNWLGQVRNMAGIGQKYGWDWSETWLRQARNLAGIAQEYVLEEVSSVARGQEHGHYKSSSSVGQGRSMAKTGQEHG